MLSYLTQRYASTGSPAPRPAAEGARASVWRAALVLAGVLAAAMLLAGCSTTGPSEEEKPPQEQEPPTPEGLPEPPAGFTWQQIPELTDEFDGASLDRSKWIPTHPRWSGRAPSQFDSANVSVENGNALLRSTTEVEDTSEVDDPTEDIWVQAASLATPDTVVSYGYYEARIKASMLTMTSSFWLSGPDYSEIDVVEQIGAPRAHPRKSDLMLMNTHYYKGGWENDISTPMQWEMPSGSAEEYHTYGVWWKGARTVWFYHDGQRVATATIGGPFEEKMWLIFDTEVFVWEGLPTVEALNDPERNAMYVDWVRSWKLVETEQ